MHDLEQRVNELMGELAQKELERMRLAEALRLILIAEACVDASKTRRDLNTAAKHRQVNAAIAEKYRALERGSLLLRSMGL